VPITPRPSLRLLPTVALHIAHCAIENVQLISKNTVVVNIILNVFIVLIIIRSYH